MPAKILFICTGNTCRSSMAKALAQRWVKDNTDGSDVEIMSAGLAAWPGSPASKEAVLALGEMEIDLSGHKAQRVSQELLAESDLVLTMTTSHKIALVNHYPEYKGKVYTIYEYISGWDCTSNDYGADSGDVCDPFGQDLEVYRNCADQLRSLIDKALTKFLSLSSE